MKINYLLLSALTCFWFFASEAQNLPTVQKISLRAPEHIKIDGKTTEWGNKLQAYNKATDISYTISNDDNNLYVTVQAKYHDVVDKIIRGGLTFTINHALKKNDPEHISITYPVLRNADMAAVSNMYAKSSNEKRDANGGVVAADDLNKLFEAKSKVINIEGIKTLTDASISVYNSDGIKTAALFDTNVTYTYELSIPLKYLALPNNGADAFSYQIKLNEPAEIHPSGHSAPPPPMMMEQLSTTDFWGEYTLAQK